MSAHSDVLAFYFTVKTYILLYLLADHVTLVNLILFSCYLLLTTDSQYGFRENRSTSMVINI